MLSRRNLVAAGAVVAALCAGCGSTSSGTSSGSTSSASTGASGPAAGNIGPGITTPSPLAPFVPSGQAGAKPNLPAVIAYAQDNPRGFEQLLASGLQAGARDAGLQFKSAESNGDPQKQVQNMQQFLVQGVGAMVTAPVDPTAQAPVMRQAMGQGVDVEAVVFGPATSQVDAPQYLGGKTLAQLAASYIRTKLGGKADVVLLNQDSVQPIRPRFQAMRDVFKTMPGVKIVADVEPAQTDSEHAFQTMTTVLQKVPHVDVVLGADAVVEGALAALQAAHKDSPSQFLAGVDCESQALADIAKGGPYKACVGTEPAIFGYAWARYAGDWLAGKTIPQGISVLPVAVTNAAEVTQYQQDEANPAAVFNDPQRFSKYMRAYGSISYVTRSKYLAYSWEAPGHNAGS